VARREEDVAICLRDLRHRDEKERVVAAQALTCFVYQADDQETAMASALTALAAALGDASLKVRRAVANSLVALVPDATGIPDGFVKTLTRSLKDEDQVVRSRVEKVLKRVKKKARL
jgi:HEAT repeat protein